MLNERLLRERPDEVIAGLHHRNASPETLAAYDQWRTLDAERRALATRRDALAADRKRLTSRRTAPDAAAALEALDRDLAEAQRAQRARGALDERLRALALRLPNLPDARVPAGASSRENVELRRWGEPPTFDFAPRAHEQVATALGMLDLARATTLAGSRFPLLLGVGARLARALAALMLDLHANRGYIEVAPPHLLRGATLEGTGHLPRHQDDLYQLAGDDLYLSPTAEAQLVALHANETLPAAALPLAYTACAPAFRREAGSTSAITHGLIRQHQFDKVEIVRIAAPGQADEAFETLLADAEAVLQRLELPYRVVALCAGDLPFSAQRTVDLEVWMAGQPADAGDTSDKEGMGGKRSKGRYVEVSSVSDCGTFQSRRLHLRYRPADGGHARYPHTLNGSALAIGRTLAALLENNQRADGSIALPAALASYLPERELRAIS